MKHFKHIIRRDGLGKVMVQSKLSGSREIGVSATQSPDIITNTSIMPS